MEATKEKKRKIPGYIWVIVIIAILSLIFTEGDILKVVPANIQGRRNAITYIEKKYGFTPTIRDIKYDVYTVLFPLPIYISDHIYVKMNYNGKTFYTYINYDNDELDGYDNYQADEIKAGFERELENLIGGEIKFSTLCYGKHHTNSGQRDYGLVKTYYDGTNLSEVLGNAYYNIANVGYLEGSMKDVTEEELKNAVGQNASYTFVKPQDDETCEFLEGYKFHDCEWGSSNIYEVTIFLDEYADRI